MFLSNGAVVSVPAGALADRTPLFANASYYSRSTLELTGQYAAYGQIYRRQIWVNILVRKLAGATARLSLDLRESDDPQAGLDTTSDLYRLLQKPNDRMSPFRLKQWTASTRKIYGEAFWLKLRDLDGQVRELHPLHPTNVIVWRKPSDGSLWYIYSSGVRGASMLPPIPAADVVPFLSYDPDTIERGMSVLEPLRETLLNEDAIRRANAAFWRNGARPAMVLKTNKVLKDIAAKRLQAAVAAAHGGADRTGGTLVLEDGVEAEAMQLNSEEMQYVDSRRLNRDEVCSAFDVPPPVVHILDKATFSNVTEQMRSMYRDTMAPDLTDYESVIAHHLVPDFGGTQVPRFNIDEVLRGDFEARSKAVTGLVDGGVMTPNEARPLFSLAPAGPEADRLYANNAFQPLGTPVAGSLPKAAEPGALPAPKPQLAIEPPRPEAVRAERSAMGAFGTKGASLTRDRLVEEHARQLRKAFALQGAEALASLTRKAARAPFNAQNWDTALADLFTGLATATSRVMGSATATELGGAFDIGVMAEWIRSNATAAAQAINTVTLDQLATALEDADDPAAAIARVYDTLTGSRTDQIAATRVTVVGGHAQRTAAGQSGAAYKTWITGPNARPEHAAMAGQTVPISATFSNGMHGPGDYGAGADEVAGCNCTLAFTKGAS